MRRVKRILSAALAALSAVASASDPDPVAALEGDLRAAILEKVDEANPIDPATGARKYVSFGFIADIHKCRRVPGDDAAKDPVTDYWYGSAGVLTEPEPSIRLLGSVATDAGLDAAIVGGDLSTAPISNGKGLTEAEYTNEIWNVKAMFARHLPAAVPLFVLDGNHERSYAKNGAEMHLSDEAWAYVQTNFNTSAEAARARGVGVTYHRDLPNATLGEGRTGRFAGNSYHLDFRRLLASGGPDVRIACISTYDAAEGSKPDYRVFDAGQFYDPATGEPYDPALTPENTVMGMVSHEGVWRLAGTLQNGFLNGWSNPLARKGPWNLGAHKGRGFFGLVAAHLHTTNVGTITHHLDEKANPDNAVHASMVQVVNAFAANKPCRPKEHTLGTEHAYHFSLFVVDTDANRLREIRVGGRIRGVAEDPVVQLHETDVRTNASPPAPAE